jgi:hypothetical protein
VAQASLASAGVAEKPRGLAGLERKGERESSSQPIDKAGAIHPFLDDLPISTIEDPEGALGCRPSISQGTFGAIRV